MFEKVTGGRAERLPCLQFRTAAMSMAAHAASALAIAVVSVNSARSEKAVEKATFLILHSPVERLAVPSAPLRHPARRPAAAVAAAARRALGPGSRREGETRRAVERILPPPTLTVAIPPRGIGDVSLKGDAGSGSALGSLVGDGAPLVDSAVLGVAPTVVNRRTISTLLGDWYPPGLKFRGIQGEVVVAFIIGVDGRAEMNNVAVISATHRGFIRPALEGLRRMRFHPAELDGVRVRVRVTLPIRWVLEDAE